jgi:hypothetical protein
MDSPTLSQGRQLRSHQPAKEAAKATGDASKDAAEAGCQTTKRAT